MTRKKDQFLNSGRSMISEEMDYEEVQNDFGRNGCAQYLDTYKMT